MLSSSLFSITPRIVGDPNGLTAMTSKVAQLLMLFARFRRVRVDVASRMVTIEDRTWWFRRRSYLTSFDEVVEVTYGYEEYWLSRQFSARDPIDRFLVGLKLKSGEEVPLFWFVGDGTFTNESPYPDLIYWEDYIFDVTGTQEKESRMFAKALGKILGAPVGPSTLTTE